MSLYYSFARAEREINVICSKGKEEGVFFDFFLHKRDILMQCNASPCPQDDRMVRDLCKLLLLAPHSKPENKTT